MNEIIALQNVSFTYGNRTIPTLSEISLTIRQGEFVLITGSTGCGKSTLIKMMNGLIPHESGGNLSGQVIVDGRNTAGLQVADLSHLVGMVFQSPDDQIFSTTVEDEVAFVLENMGVLPVEIHSKVKQALEEVGLAGKEQSSVHALSGGQKQRLAIAAVLVAQPKVLVLDEPISQLDPLGAAELLTVLLKLNQSFGVTIIIIEHRLHEVAPLCQRIIVMDQGKIAWDGAVQQAFEEPEVFIRHGLRLPQAVDICHQLGIKPPVLDPIEAAAVIRKHCMIVNTPMCCRNLQQLPNVSLDEVITISQLAFRYDENDVMVLKDINLSVQQGEIVALMGTNGAGKSTLLQHISGILRSTIGQVIVNGNTANNKLGNVGMVLQNPDMMLFTMSVFDEIAFVLRQEKRASEYSIRKLVEKMIAQLGLQGLENDFPLALSRGQRLRVAIAAVLVSKPAVLLLDEPTTGQDIAHIEDIALLIQQFAKNGGTTLFCTHDTEVAARFATRVVVMAHGEILADGSPLEIFSQEKVLASAGLKTPPVLLISQALNIKAALSVKEVVEFVRQANMGSNTG